MLGAPFAASAEEAPPAPAAATAQPEAPQESAPPTQPESSSDDTGDQAPAPEPVPEPVPEPAPAPESKAPPELKAPPVETPPVETPAAETPAETPPADAPVAETTEPPAASAPAPKASAKTTAPIDCNTIPIANDDRSARDACLAKQPQARAFATQSTVSPDPNPDLQPKCGIDFSLVLDRSGSIGNSGMASLKAASDAFTAALVDTGSSVSAVAFNDDASSILGDTELTSGNLAGIQGSYAGLTSDGWTNWKRGLELSNADALTIMITDGNPNTVDPSNGGEFPDGSSGALDPAVVQANALKGSGSHMFVIAVGDSVSLGPIQAISGDEAYDGSNFASADYVQTADYDALADDLQAIALELCGGNVLIHKAVAGDDAAGWEFSSPTSSVAPTPQLTGDDGWTEPFEVDNYGDTDTRTVTFVEEDREYYTMDSVSCEVDKTPVDVTELTDTSWQVEVGKLEIVRCFVVNSEDPPVWTVTKSADPPSGTAVDRGDTVDYTLSIEHVSGPQATDLVIDDDISGLAPYVTFEGFIGTQPASFSWNDATPGELTLTVDSLDPGETLDLTYRVMVADDAPAGITLKNHVLTNCPGDQNGGDEQDKAAVHSDPAECRTQHPTPGYAGYKTSVPFSGSQVDPGEEIEYTLHASNFSEADVIGATMVDDLGDVLDDATLVEPLDSALSLSGDELTWSIPDLAVGSAEATVSFAVLVNDDAWGATLHNVVTPEGPGECPELTLAKQSGDKGDWLPPCETEHTVPDVDLSVMKSATTPEGDAVDSGSTPPDVITYEVLVENLGTDPAYSVDVTDVLPDGTVFVPGSEMIVTVPAGEETNWTVDDSVSGELTFSYPAPFGPEDTATITFEVEVGELAQPDPTVPIPNLVNSVCVYSGPERPDEASDTAAVALLDAVAVVDADASAAPASRDSNPANDCDDAETPVKSITVDAAAQCINDTPVFEYAVEPVNVGTPSTIALIWWTPEAFAAHDPSIPVTDEAALLADGASQVDYLEVPPGWSPGDVLTGTQLWPGAAVDAEGNPVAWPGWALQSDGTWVLDPSAPFYDLRDVAVVEVRVNPSTDVETVYPPATPDCNAAPPETPPTPDAPVTPAQPASSGAMAATGVDTLWMVPAGLGLLVLGALAVAAGLRARRSRGD